MQCNSTAPQTVAFKVIQLNQYLSKTVLRKSEHYNFHEGAIASLLYKTALVLDWCT